MKPTTIIITCLLLGGCAHDNGIVYRPAPKPAPADTITAVGNVLGGAWDRLKGNK